jgi:hypothetical protein
MTTFSARDERDVGKEEKKTAGMLIYFQRERKKCVGRFTSDTFSVFFLLPHGIACADDS